MLGRGESRDSIANHLLTLESQMGVSVDRIEYLRRVANKLQLLKLPTLVVRVRFLTPEEGGRKVNVHDSPSYRPHLVVGDPLGEIVFRRRTVSD